MPILFSALKYYTSERLTTVCEILKARHRPAPPNIHCSDKVAETLVNDMMSSKFFILCLSRATNLLKDQLTLVRNPTKSMVKPNDKPKIFQPVDVDRMDIDEDCHLKVLGSEAYMALYLRTDDGKAEVQRLCLQQPGIWYKSTIGYLEVASYIRERLTGGTPLYKAFQYGPNPSYFTPKELMVFAFLKAADRTLASVDVYKYVRLVFWPLSAIPQGIAAEMAALLQVEETTFENDFVLVMYRSDNTPVFSLPPGYENKVLARLFMTEKFPYYNMPDYTSDNGDCSPLMSKLPAELLEKVFNYLFAFKESVEVVLTSSDRRKYGLVIHQPHHMRIRSTTTPVHLPGRQTWDVAEPKDFFAIAATNRQNYVRAREAFFKNNKIIFAKDGRHLEVWLKAIGPTARWFLADLTIKDIRMPSRPYTENNPSSVHHAFRLLGESGSLHSLVIEEFYMPKNTPTCKVNMKKGLKSLSYLRGLEKFVLGLNLELETHFRGLVTRPKDAKVYEEQPAYMPGNRKARDLKPLEHKVLMGYNKDILQYLYVHTRTSTDQHDNTFRNEIAREFKKREAEAATMTKKSLVDALVEKKATWTQGAQKLKDNHQADLRKMRSTATSNLVELPGNMEVDS